MRLKLIIILTTTFLAISCSKEKKRTTNNHIAKTEYIATTKTDRFLDEENPMKSLADIYKKNKKTVQSFTINVDIDTTITCQEGTKITFFANSLVCKNTGEAIKGNITVQVTEYYKLSDLLFANLTTTSDGEILETGGMINIEAYAKGEKLILDEGRTIQVYFPTKKKKKGMRLFLGRWKNNKVNWISTENLENITQEKVYNDVANYPVFVGGEKALSNYLNSELEYPMSARDSNITGTVIVSFVIDKYGKPRNIGIEKGITFELNSAAASLVYNMPDWIPGNQNGKNVNVRMTLPIQFCITDVEPNTNFKTTNTFSLDKYICNMTDKELQKTDKTKIYQYIFKSSHIGWINCDRFVNDTRKKTDFLITNCLSSDITVIIPKLNSIIQVVSKGNKSVLENVPVGESISIIAIKNVKGKNYLATKETIITENGETFLDFKSITNEDLKKLIESKRW
jgi:TonB family protein